MNPAIITSEPTSRPKIHRPPVLPPEPQKRRTISALLSYGSSMRVFFTASSAVLGAVLALLLASHFLPVGMIAKTPPAHPVVADAEAFTQAASKIIVLRDEKDVIVGQMARLASPVTPLPEVSTMSSEVDKRKGQELLSIINKY
jgi:hypothetical protein